VNRHLLTASLLVWLCASSAPAASSDAAPFDEGADLGMSQGVFTSRIIQRAGGERLFPGTVTPSDTADALANVGFAPAGGWQVNAPLTRRVIDSAYLHLLDVLEIRDAGAPAEALALRLRTSRTVLREGDEIACMVEVANDGFAAADGIRLQLTVPAILLARAADGVPFDPASGILNVGALAPGAVRRFAVPARVALAGKPVDDASGRPLRQRCRVAVLPAEGRPADPARPLPVAEWEVMAWHKDVPLADLAVQIAADNIIPQEGDKVLFTITVTNQGPDAAAAIAVEERLPPELEREGRSGPVQEGKAGWLLPALAPGEAVRLGLTVKVRAPEEKDRWLAIGTVGIAELAQTDPNGVDNQADSKLLIRLIERISRSVRWAVVPTTTERQPVSPSRPLRR
jgi:uncharacterized repeat protein (TIGR01451 family)